MGNTASAAASEEVPVLDLPNELSVEGADAGFGGKASTVPEVGSHEYAAIAAAAALNINPPAGGGAVETEPKQFTVPASSGADGTGTEHQLLCTVHEYRLEPKVLGEGGFGKVKLATSTISGHQVAVKIIKRSKLKGRTEELLKREVANHALLRHKHIVRLYTWIKTPQRYYLVMEYCAKGDLLHHLNKKTRFTDDEARHFFRQLLDGLRFCHSLGLFHRDLKLENLMLTEPEQEGSLPLLKIADFGLSALKPFGLLETHCGSPLYAAPELMQEKGEYDGAKSDMWSCGVILFAMLASALPFDASDMTSLVRLICSGVPTRPLPGERGMQAKRLVMALLSLNASARPTAAEALEDPWMTAAAEQEGIKASVTLEALAAPPAAAAKDRGGAAGTTEPHMSRMHSAPTHRTGGEEPAAHADQTVQRLPPEEPSPAALDGVSGTAPTQGNLPTAVADAETKPAALAASKARQSSGSVLSRGVSATSAFFKEMLAKEEARAEAEAEAAGDDADAPPSGREPGARLTKKDMEMIRAEMEREGAD